MNDLRLHIVSFDVPYPPNYGGVVDVFYRIKALHALGVKIHLHCFEYGRGRPEELEKYVEEIHYYKRKKVIIDWFRLEPFIARTRSTRNLIKRLDQQKYPILFEGLHTCHFLSDERLHDRIKLVRTHNIEHEYYAALALKSTGWKKRFYASEARKLKRFEKILTFATHIVAIKKSDESHFKQYCQNVFELPASAPDVNDMEYRETESYCLFHGNLSVIENEVASIWLINNVFIPLDLCDKFKIAGKDPSIYLIEYCSKNGVDLIPNPNQLLMDELLQLARVHVFYSDQFTGVKLKMVNALHTSGHIIANGGLLKGTEFAGLCSLALIAEDYRYFVEQKLMVELSVVDYNDRKSFVEEHLNTRKNCQLILDIISDKR